MAFDANVVVPTISMGDDTTLEINGSLEASGGTQVSITGSPGVNEIIVGLGATVLAEGELGDGDDELIVAGTLDTGAGLLDLGAGEDTLTLQDGSDVIGIVDGGTGADVLITDINTSASLGAETGFEALQKTGTGTLNIVGPAPSDFETVTLNEGALNIVPGGAIIDVQEAVIGPDASINLDGSFSFTTGGDSLEITGTVTGSGTFDMQDGNDVLTLNDGFDISGFTGQFGGGVNDAAGDMVVVNVTSDISVDASLFNGFETLDKQSSGTLTLTGNHEFELGAEISGGTLAVADTLTAPTLDMGDGTTLQVDGTVQGLAGVPTVVTGSVGDNAINVAAGGMLMASGDLGGGSDELDLSGSLFTGGGALSLGDGTDTLTIQNGAIVIGIVDGGDGADILNTDISGTALIGALTGFEELDKTGAGALVLTGPTASEIEMITLTDGTLRVEAAASITGVTTASVENGALLALDGSIDFTTGSDSFDIAGEVTGSGSVDLGTGDDALALNEGFDLSGFTGQFSGGANDAAGDAVSVSITSNATLDAALFDGFETLDKQSGGALTLTGDHVFDLGVDLNGGTLAVAGSLETQSLNMADGTTAQISGTVEGPGGTPTTLTGSAGQNVLDVSTGATLRANGDLGSGADDLSLAGTLDTGTGVLSLGDGTDTFTLQDDATVIGTVDGGTGADILNTDIATSATVGALTGFEELDKTGAGTLTLTGPAASEIETVAISDGTLAVGAGASITGVTQASLINGATLDLAGSIAFTADGNSFDIAGDVTGAGTVDLGDGDDALTFSEGYDLSGFTGQFAGGANAGAGDAVNVNITTTATLDASLLDGFEVLDKQDSGVLTLTGNHVFDLGVDISGGTLAVTDSLETQLLAMADGTSLQVGGTVQPSGGAATVLNGSAGDNAIDVAFAGVLRAQGDLGDGADTVTLAGTLDTGTGSLSLGDGSDTFTLQDGATVLGSIDGGGGVDTLNTDIATSASMGSVDGFETLDKTGAGTLNLTGPDASAIDTVLVNEGTLNVQAGAAITGVTQAELADGATLNLEGDLGFSSGDSRFDMAGDLTGGDDVTFGAGADTLTILGSADLSGFSGTLDGGDGNADTTLFDGYNGSVDGSTFQNWETISVGNGTMDFGPAIAVGTGAGQGLIAGSGGIIEMLSDTAITGSVEVLAGGTIRTTGTSVSLIDITGNLGNAGTISLQNGQTGDQIRVGGNFTGGGTLQVDVDFATSTADWLMVSGDVVAGTTTIAINDISSGTATRDEILLVDVTGATDDDDFVLASGPVEKDGIIFELDRSGGRWLLTPLASPEDILFEAHPQTLIALNTVPRLRDRYLGRLWLTPLGQAEDNLGFWVMLTHGNRQFAPNFSTTAQAFGASSGEYDVGLSKFEMGVDTVVAEGGSGRLIGNAQAFYAAAGMTVTSSFQTGKIDADASGFGAGLTWYDDSGLYLDGQLQFAKFKSDILAPGQSLASSIKGDGLTASIEAGWRFDLTETLSLTPEIQYTRYDVDFDSFASSTGQVVQSEDGTQTELRFGGTLELQAEAAEGKDNRFFVSANVFHLPDAKTVVRSGTTRLISELPDWRGEIGIGGLHQWTGEDRSRMAFYGNLTAGTDFGSSFSEGRSVIGQLGFKMEF